MGLKADFALSDDISLMLAVTNPWDTSTTFLLQVNMDWVFNSVFTTVPKFI